jgi:hypothetical protein
MNNKVHMYSVTNFDKKINNNILIILGSIGTTHPVPVDNHKPVNRKN